jgi:hypothetical protein
MHSYYAKSVLEFAKQFKSPVTIYKESNMKMFTVIIKVSDQNTGTRYVLTTETLAKTEIEARSIAFTELADPYLLDVNILTVDINENLNRFRLVDVKPA